MTAATRIDGSAWSRSMVARRGLALRRLGRRKARPLRRLHACCSYPLFVAGAVLAHRLAPIRPRYGDALSATLDLLTVPTDQGQTELGCQRDVDRICPTQAEIGG